MSHVARRVSSVFAIPLPRAELGQCYVVEPAVGEARTIVTLRARSIHELDGPLELISDERIVIP